MAGRLALGALLIGLFAAALASPPPSGATGTPRPSPDKLLRQFPLNPPKAPARPKAHPSAGRSPSAGGSPEKPKAPHGPRTGLEIAIIVAAAVVAALVALLAAGRSLLRRRRLRAGADGQRERPWLRRPAQVLRELASEEGSARPEPAAAATHGNGGNGSDVVSNLLVSVDRAPPSRAWADERPKLEQRPEADDRMEQPPVKPVAEPEVDLLKEKGTDALLQAKLKKVDQDETEILKAKLGGPPQAEESEAQTLKAKLERVPAGTRIAASRTPPRAAPAKRERPPAPDTASVRRQTPRAEQLRAVPDPEPPAPITHPLVGQTCRITLWRGYAKSRFYAVTRTATGDAVIAKSPAFSWWKPRSPSKDREDVAAAHAALVESLEREGWAATGRRTSWFGLELGRRKEQQPQWRRPIDSDVRRNSEARGREGQGEQSDRRSV